MPFDSGKLSFCIYKYEQDLPENHLDLFQEKAACALEHIKEEPSEGWVARHLLERKMTEETSYTGDYLTLQYRTASKKIPASLMKAECAQRELALMQAENLSTLSRKKKKEIKEEVQELLIKDMPPQLGGIPFVIDKTAKLIYVASSSIKQADNFIQYFIETLDIECLPLTSQELCNEILGEGSFYQVDLLDFTGKGIMDEGTEKFLGRDFLVWLWFLTEQEESKFIVPDLGEFELGIDGPLTLVAENFGAFESVLRKGLPTKSPEAHMALQAGKKLKSAQIMLGRADEFWTFTFDADNFIFKTLALPDGEALERVSKFEERMENLYTFQKAFFHLYKVFLTSMFGDDSEENLAIVQSWVQSRKFHFPEA